MLFCRTKSLVFQKTHVWIFFSSMTIQKLLLQKYTGFTITISVGTTDITVHRITNSESMEEIFSPSGGAWGSTQIDRAFQKLLEKLLGENFINDLMSHHSCVWLSLMKKFEKAKKRFGKKAGRGISIDMSYNFIDIYEKSHQTTIDKVIGRNKSLGVSMVNGCLQISCEASLGLIKPVILKIVEHVENLLKNKSLQRVSSLLSWWSWHFLSLKI